MPYVILQEVRDGKVMRGWHYYDRLLAFEQEGIVSLDKAVRPAAGGILSPGPDSSAVRSRAPDAAPFPRCPIVAFELPQYVRPSTGCHDDRPAARTPDCCQSAEPRSRLTSREVCGRTLAVFCIAGQTQQPDGRDESAGARPGRKPGLASSALPLCDLNPEARSPASTAVAGASGIPR